MIDEKVLIERLEESEERYDDVSFAQLNEFGHTLDYEYAKGKRDGMVEAKEIVKNLASEHNNGWIPCSERLPENNRDVYVTYINKMTGDSISSVGWYSQEEKTWFVGHNDTRQKVTAWCPKLPPYKKGE